MIGDGRARGFCALAAAVAVFSGETALATVLYDTTGMVDAGTYSAAGTQAVGLLSYIGFGINNGGVPSVDTQCADDFSLAGQAAITSVTADFLTSSSMPGMVAPRTGVLVEFFSDVGGLPSADPYQVAPGQTAQFFATPDLFTATTFAHNGTGTNISPNGLRLTIDLTSAGITLPGGTWWMSVVPVDLTAEGILYRHASRTETLGANTRRRAGGTFHGNGYGGGGFSSTAWAIPPGGTAQKTLSFRVEGTLIPSPAGVALLGLAGLMSNRRRRREH